MKPRYGRRAFLTGMGTLTVLVAGATGNTMPLNEAPSIRLAPRFHVVEIGVPDPDRTREVQGHKISSDGKYVAGHFGDSSGTHAFIWKDGKFEHCSNYFSIAVAVNKDGVAAGFTVRERGRSPGSHATFWKDGNESLVFADKQGSDCKDMDDAGNIYGHHFLDEWRGFIRSADGKVRYIEEGTRRYCLVICGNQGRVCAHFINADDYSQETIELYDGGKLIRLLSPAGGSGIKVKAINKNGVVVGGGGSPFVPLLWHNGKPEVLPGFPSNWHGAATGINAAGDVVGYFRLVQDGPLALFLGRRGKCYDLTRLLDRSDLRLVSTEGISDNGIILATGRVKDPKWGDILRSYLLVPR